jgi:hypothetical protein
MTTKAPISRADRIENYVQLSASSGLLYKLVEATTQDDDEPGDEHPVSAMGDSLMGDLDVELWADPDADGDPAGPEYEAAVTRAIMLEAAVLMQLTTADAQNFLRMEAARLANLAADRMAASNA